MLCPAGLPQAQSSSSFVMERVTIAAEAGQASSASFVLLATLAQEGPVGSASLCNSGHVHSLGFWSILGGDAPPDTLLSVRHNPLDPAAVDLFWSGSSPTFDVYRATAPTAVAEPFNVVATTSSCTATDAPPDDLIIYYLVLPSGT